MALERKGDENIMKMRGIHGQNNEWNTAQRVKDFMLILGKMKQLIS